MIKLTNILKEMAIRNAWSGETKEEKAAQTDVVIEAAKAMGLNNPVLWRGTRGIPGPKGTKSTLTRIMYITGDRAAFRGGHQNAKKVLQLLGIDQPVFAHFDRAMTVFFGTPCALVLEQPYKLYQSTEVNDIMADTNNWETTVDINSGGRARSSIFKEKTDQDLQNIANTYKEIYGKPKYGDHREVIVDVKNYWAIPCDDSIKTYGDLVQLLEEYKAKFFG